MQNKFDLDNQSFFGKGVEFWLGKIVKFSEQRSQTSGMGWGWRYKVRIIGDYSNLDSVKDKDVHTAVALLPSTAGTGGAGRSATVKLAQGDVVFGVFLAPNNGFPIILGALGKTKNLSKDDGSKFGNLTGFVGKLIKGLTEGQEHTGQDQMNTPKIEEGSKKGGGRTKEVPTNNGLEQVKDGNNEENAIGAVSTPSSPIIDKFANVINLDPEIVNEINKINDINNAEEVLNGIIPADKEEYNKLKYDYVRKMEEAFDTF